MSSYYHAKKREAEPAARGIRDEVLREKIMEVWEGEKGRKVYGARKIWLELSSRGIPVARCTVERLIRELRRANEILKAASAYFARELDPRLPR